MIICLQSSEWMWWIDVTTRATSSTRQTWNSGPYMLTQIPWSLQNPVPQRSKVRKCPIDSYRVWLLISNSTLRRRPVKHKCTRHVLSEALVSSVYIWTFITNSSTIHYRFYEKHKRILRFVTLPLDPDCSETPRFVGGKGGGRWFHVSSQHVDGHLARKEGGCGMRSERKTEDISVHATGVTIKVKKKRI